MGKYSGIVNSKNQSGKPENVKASNTENNKTGKPESQKALKVKNQKAGKPESNKSGNQQSMKTSNTENQKAVSVDMVNLSIKVPRRLRQKWVAESRLRGSTLTAIISDYLKNELGE